jgi:hypothetical protein
MKVGDKVPWPKGMSYDPVAVKIAMGARGKIKRASSKAAKNVRIKQAQLIMAEHDDAERRATDPFEQARLYLGRRNYPVFNRAIYGPMHSGFQVGKRVMASKDDVIDYARSLGWTG